MTKFDYSNYRESSSQPNDSETSLLLLNLAKRAFTSNQNGKMKEITCISDSIQLVMYVKGVIVWHYVRFANMIQHL